MDQAQQKWQFDWKQIGDYLLGRSTLIGTPDDAADTCLPPLARHADFIMGGSGDSRSRQPIHSNDL
jgi:hypothetical protein